MEPFLTKNGYDISLCPSCLLGQTDLRQNYELFLKEYYDEGYYTGDTTRVAYVSYADDKKCIKKNLQKYLALIKKNQPSGSLLDVGCAFGYMVEMALEYGYDAYGFDPSEFAIHNANKTIQSKITCATISSARYKRESFDIVTLLDVFEHLYDPQKDLEKIYSWLKPGGLLLIATGDTSSLLPKLLKRRWTFYIPPQHLYFYNSENIKIALVRSKFNPISISRVGKWVSLQYVLHLAKTTGESKFARYLERITRILNIGTWPLFLPVQDNMVVLSKK